ncbi:alpha/beta fold hydrolase [Amycolatopsis lurida]
MTPKPDGRTLVEPRVVEIDGVPMSALVRQVPDPHAVIVALHGGGASSAYFHYPGLPRLSLLETGAALGFTVLALDRPGYGRSAPFADRLLSPEQRVGIAYATVDRLLGSSARGAGLFVLAHSAGCELAVRMAASDRGRSLLGLELAGTGLEFHPAMRSIVGQPRPGRRGGLQGILWEPASLYPTELLGGAHFAASSPAYEADVIRRWVPRDFALAATRVRVPVQYTLGQHDRVWRTDPDVMADVAALFTAAPRVVVNVQADSAHNLSTGHTATAYHLRALSFVEECVITRRESRRETGGS